MMISVYLVSLLALLFFGYIYLQGYVDPIGRRRWLTSTNASTIQVFNPMHYHRTLVTTINMVLDKPRECGARSLLIIVHSPPQHLRARMAIRQTWGGHLVRQHRIRVYFFLGTSSDAQAMKTIEHEDLRFADILQTTLIDTEEMQTHKTMSMLAWVTKNCPHTELVLKLRDDAFVNVNKLATFVRTFRPGHSMIMSNLNEDRIGGYFFTGHVAHRLYQAAFAEPFWLDQSDRFIVDKVAKKVNNIFRFDHPGIEPKMLSFLDDHNDSMLLFSHGHQPQQIAHRWQHLYFASLNLTHSVSRKLS